MKFSGLLDPLDLPRNFRFTEGSSAVDDIRRKLISGVIVAIYVFDVSAGEMGHAEEHLLVTFIREQQSDYLSWIRAEHSPYCHEASHRPILDLGRPSKLADEIDGTLDAGHSVYLVPEMGEDGARLDFTAHCTLAHFDWDNV